MYNEHLMATLTTHPNFAGSISFEQTGNFLCVKPTTLLVEQKQPIIIIAASLYYCTIVYGRGLTTITIDLLSCTNLLSRVSKS